MPPILVIGAALAISAVGTAVSIAASSKSASANEDIAAQQQQSNAIQQQAMETDAQRRQLEVVRQAQVARATATSSAVSQNAQLGSGLQGGYGQISGEENTNLLGIQQNLQFGREQFAINNQISNDRISLASAQGMSGWGSGLTSIGNTMMSAYGASTRLSQVPFGSGQQYGRTYGSPPNDV